MLIIDELSNIILKYHDPTVLYISRSKFILLLIFFPPILFISMPKGLLESNSKFSNKVNDYTLIVLSILCIDRSVGVHRCNFIQDTIH